MTVPVHQPYGGWQAADGVQLQARVCLHLPGKVPNSIIKLTSFLNRSGIKLPQADPCHDAACLAERQFALSRLMTCFVTLADMLCHA